MTAPQAAQAARASTGSPVGAFFRDTFNPEAGLAGQQVFNRVGAGQLPHVGDVATYALQKMLNNYIQQSLGPGYQPTQQLVLGPPQRQQPRRTF